MKGLMGIYFKNRGLATRIIIGCITLFFIIAQTGCTSISRGLRGKLSSGKYDEQKGKLVQENQKLVNNISEDSPVLKLRMNTPYTIEARLLVRTKSRFLVERSYEKVVTYRHYDKAKPIGWFERVDNPRHLVGIVPLALVSELTPLGLFAMGEDPNSSCKHHDTENIEGEIQEKEFKDIEYDRFLQGVDVRFDCGPAGQYVFVTDKTGRATLPIKSLLNRLTRDNDWTIKATATYKKQSVRNTITLNTTQLGVTWAKPRFQPDLPPRIIATARFKDQNNNQMLDAKEKATLIITLKNTGRGDAFRIDVKPEFTGKVEGVEISPSNQLQIETLAKGKEKTVEFSLSATEEVPAQRFRVRMSFAELNGFEPAPLMVNLATRPYSPPKLVLARWSLDDDNEGLSTGNGNRRLERGEQAELTLFIQNLGAGAAENVQVEFKANDSNLYTKALAADLGEIPPGEWRKAVFILRVNNRYNGPEKLPVDVAINERRPKFALAQPLEIMLGQDVSKEKEVMLAGDMRPVPTPTLSPLPKIKRKKSIEITDLVRGTEYAVLIAINNYIDSEVRSLSYAEADINALYSVLTDSQISGYDKNNVFLMTPGSEQPQDRPTRTNILLTLKWLSENLKPEDSVLFVFCGHGDTDKDVNYIIPLDGRLALPQDSSVRLGRLFEWLDACPARRQVVMLDACHSGGPATLRRGDRGIAVVSTAFTEELQRIGAPEGRAVLSSSSIEEVSYEEPKLGHGVFTYYVLDGLKSFKADRNKDDRITVYELGHFVQAEVKSWSKRNRKSPSQTPRMVYNDTSGEIVLAGSK